MNLEIGLFAGLKCNNPELPSHGERDFRLDVSDWLSIRQLRDLLGINPAMPLLVMVNNHREQENFLLKDGDRIGMFPPIGGG
ncbi:MAG: MoaD/ThiS family protein [Pseudomonadota bacterium]